MIQAKHQDKEKTLMNKEQLMKKLQERFDGVAQIYSKSDNRIELDVSTNLDKTDWIARIQGLDLTDNSKHIPNSWKHNDITILFFCGNINSFIPKANKEVG